MPFSCGMFEDANRYGANYEAFRSHVRQWKVDGFDVVVCSNGDLDHVDGLLAVCDEEGFSYVGNAATEINPYLYNTTTWQPLTDEGTQEEADAIVEPIVATLGAHPSLKAWYLTDEPHTAQTERLKKLKRAFNTFDGSRPVTFVAVGLNRGDVIAADVGVSPLLLDVYPIGIEDEPMDLTLQPFGYEDETFTSYTRSMISGSGIDQTQTPLWMILQTHDVVFDLEPEQQHLFSMRRPTLAELRMQFFLAIGEGADLISWFIWGSRTPDAGGFGGWTGLEDLPAEYGQVAALANRVRPFRDLLADAYRSASQDFSTDAGYCATLDNPAPGGVRRLVVVCNTTASSASLTVSGTEGTLRNLETNTTISVGDSVTLASGDGRIYEWTADENTLPAGNDGVPKITIPDYQQPVRQWWAAHPFNPESSAYNPVVNVYTTNVDVNAAHEGSIQAAIDALTPGTPTTLYIGAGTYSENVNVVGHKHLHFRAKSGVTPVLTGTWRVIPTWDANYYHGNPSNTQWNSWTDMVKRNRITPGQGGSPQARAHTFLAGGENASYDLLWKGFTFDRQGQRTSSLNFSTLADVVVEDCTFTGMIVPTNPASHPGNVSGNAYLNNITLRNCAFNGRGAYGSGNSDRPRYGAYLDGVHGGAFINCSTPSEQAYANAVYLCLCNDDYTIDRDRSGVIDIGEQRMAQYVVIYGGEYGTGYLVGVIVGRQCLVKRVTVPSGSQMFYGLVNLGDKANQATVFKPSSNVDQVSNQTVSGAPNNPTDMGGNYQGGNFAPVRYLYHDSVVELNDVASANELVTYESTGTIAGKLPPDLGRSFIDDNILRTSSPTWYRRRFISVGAGGANTFTEPQSLSGNANSGELPPPEQGGGSTPNAPAMLAFTTQPAPGTAKAGEALDQQPVVEVRDITGTVIADYTGDVTLTLVSNVPGVSLGGTTTVAAVDGVATFSGLSVPSSGSGYRLRASTAGVTALSLAFTVEAAASVGGGDGEAGHVSYEGGASTSFAASLSLTLTPSIAVEEGDALIAVTYREDAQAPGTVPTGFTEQTDLRATLSNNQIRVYTKIATASEPSSYVWEYPSSPWCRAVLGIYRGADPEALLDSSEMIAYDTDGTTVALPQVTTTAENALLVGIATMKIGGNTWTAPSGMTNNGSVSQIGMFSVEQETPGETAAYTASASGGGSGRTRAGILLALAPAVTATPPAVVGSRWRRMRASSPTQRFHLPIGAV